VVIELKPRLRHTTPMRDDWTCFVCDTSGKGGTKGFYQHYMQAHV